MYYVYLIKSLVYPETFYVGYSLDFEARIATHNAGGSAHTAKYKPWELVMFLAFKDQSKAREFEQYLKSQSGRAFMQKRFT
jgi:putative endonuclease